MSHSQIESVPFPMTEPQLDEDAEPFQRPNSATELVEALRRGDRSVFERLHALYAPMVHGILLTRTSRDEVDDLTQDVFIQVLEKIHTLRDPAAFGGWLASMARNRAADFHRTTRRFESSVPEKVGGNESNIEAARILALVKQLPEAYRETLILRLVEGMTGPEIADRTGLTPASVRVNLHRGMKLLRERLETEATS